MRARRARRTKRPKSPKRRTARALVPGVARRRAGATGARKGPPPFSLAEFFANAGHLIEAAASADATVASAMAQLRLSHSPAEVRGAATYAAKLVQEALNGNAKSAGRVCTEDPLYASKLGQVAGRPGTHPSLWVYATGRRGKAQERIPGGEGQDEAERAPLKDIEEAFGEEVGCPSVQVL